MKTNFARLGLILRIAGAGLVGLVPLARAELQVLSFTVPFETQNGQSVSGNGAVVIGTAPDGSAAYWTATTGLAPIPKPSIGIEWSYSLHLNFDGSVIAGQGTNHGGLHPAAWTWRKGVGVRDVVSTTSAMNNLGVSPDGSFVVRSVANQPGGGATIRRDYSTGESFVWTEISNATVSALSEDCSTLYGVTQYPGTNQFVPCYWSLSGVINYGTEFLGSSFYHDPVRISRNGKVIVGVAYTTIPLPGGQGVVHLAFRWDLTTHQIDYYFPSGFLFTSTDFVSPDGNLYEVGGTLQTMKEAQPGIIDVTTPTEAAKGAQDIGEWMVAHRYLSSADIKKRSFIIWSMSDDLSVAVGVFTDATGEHGFIARRPRFTTIPPLGVTGQ